MAREGVDVAVVLPPPRKGPKRAPGGGGGGLRGLGPGGDGEPPPPGDEAMGGEPDARGEVLGRRLASALGLDPAAGAKVYAAVKGIVDYCKEQDEMGSDLGGEGEAFGSGGPPGEGY